MLPELRVAVDVGSARHRVAMARSDGALLEEFSIDHDAAGVKEFFGRIARCERQTGLPVVVAMEGYNGYARPLDQRVLQRGYRLFNVNNLKFARFKEMFPAPAKTDAIDARRMLELFLLKDRMPMAREVLQEVAPVPQENERLKALSRRRKQLVNERVRVSQRMQTQLRAVCPGLVEITGMADNLWFLTLLGCRDDLRKLKGLRRSTLLAMRGIGRCYAARIEAWQAEADFAPTVDWIGPMIVADARRLLELRRQIQDLDHLLEAQCARSAIAGRLASMPGFGTVLCAQIAGEIGSIARFESEAGLALYLGLAPLDNSSGKRSGARAPRQVNERAKAAMMIMTVRHMACVVQSRGYYDRKRTQGKTHNQAVRALGRHLVRVIWSMLTKDRDYQVRTPVENP